MEPPFDNRIQSGSGQGAAAARQRWCSTLKTRLITAAGSVMRTGGSVAWGRCCWRTVDEAGGLLERRAVASHAHGRHRSCPLMHGLPIHVVRAFRLHPLAASRGLLDSPPTGDRYGFMQAVFCS